MAMEGGAAPQSPVADTPAKGPDRRQILGGALVLGVLGGTPLAIWDRARAAQGDGATASEKLLLTRLADLVIPNTDTAGAVVAGVPTFVETALIHGLEETALETGGDRKRGGLVLLDVVSRDLNRRGHGDFVSLAPDRQFAVLEAYDAQAFEADEKDHPWRKIKGLILTGYYTSEIGASRELQYELVPGRWEPNLPLPAENRSWSSDWTAVDFG
ncbi:hypothetical protein FHS96_003541 [Sphingomonas zeicaulis]|uniref:gluconate 2-dehydrogenase subunit 3 family protein n=1 Tax=Sphingomonas zeicaulis TaxID=1632740 RepID=UPI003D1A9E5A